MPGMNRLFGPLRQLKSLDLPIAHFLGVSGLNIFARVVGMGGSIWTARSLTPAELGLIAFVITCQNPVLRVLGLGLEPILVRATQPLADGDAKAVFRHYLRAKVIISLVISVIWCAAFGVVFQLDRDEVATVAWILTPFFFTSSLSGLGLAQRFGKLKQSAALDLVTAFLQSSAIIALLTPGAGPVAAAQLMSATTLASCGFLYFWSRRILGSGDYASDRDQFHRHARFSAGVWPLLISLASFGYTMLEIPIVTAYYGFDSAGLYRVASTLPTALFMLVYTFSNVMYPHYVSWVRDYEACRAKLRQLGFMMLLVWASGTVAMWLTGRFWLGLLFGPVYVSGFWILVVLWSGKLIVLWVNVWSVPLVAMGRERYVASLAVATSVACVCANCMLASYQWGPLTVAILSFISELGVGFFCWLKFRRIARSRISA